MTFSKIALAALILLSSTFTFASEHQFVETTGVLGLQLILIGLVCRLVQRVKYEYQHSNVEW